LWGGVGARGQRPKVNISDLALPVKAQSKKRKCAKSGGELTRKPAAASNEQVQYWSNSKRGERRNSGPKGLGVGDFGRQGKAPMNEN